MPKWLRVFIGLSILLALLLGFDFKKIISELSSIDSTWVYLAGVSIVASTLLGAFSMFLIVSRGEEISFFKFLLVYWSSWAVGLVVPGQVGDIASISFLLRRWGFDWSSMLARSLVDKVITFIIMIIIAAYGITFIARGYFTLSKSTIWTILAATALVFILVYNWDYLKRLFRSKTYKSISIIEVICKEVVSTFYSYPLIVTANSAITVLKIVLIGLAYWLIFKALGNMNLSFWEVLPLMAASSLIAYLPISFNGIGTVELTGIILFSSIGVPEITILSAFLLLRLLVFILAWVPTALIFFFSEKITSKALS